MITYRHWPSAFFYRWWKQKTRHRR